MLLQNRKILLGVTGSIAAYKSAVLVRLLVKAGAEVKVIMTRDAEQFVTSKTLSVLSKNTVEKDFFDKLSPKLEELKDDGATVDGDGLAHGALTKHVLVQLHMVSPAAA